MSNKLTNATVALLVVASNSANAQDCNPFVPRTAPDSRYELVLGSGGSEVLDKKTGLIWQRCSIGQSWNGTTCIGYASQHTWVEALAKAKAVGNGYRLPNIKELRSLVEKACFVRTINDNFFPASSYDWYWSSSPITNDAWGVYFHQGYSYFNPKYNSYNVRAVRNGQ